MDCQHPWKKSVAAREFTPKKSCCWGYHLPFFLYQTFYVVKHSPTILDAWTPRIVRAEPPSGEVVTPPMLRLESEVCCFGVGLEDRVIPISISMSIFIFISTYLYLYIYICLHIKNIYVEIYIYIYKVLSNSLFLDEINFWFAEVMRCFNGDVMEWYFRTYKIVFRYWADVSELLEIQLGHVAYKVRRSTEA